MIAPVLESVESQPVDPIQAQVSKLQSVGVDPERAYQQFCVWLRGLGYRRFLPNTFVSMIQHVKANPVFLNDLILAWDAFAAGAYYAAIGSINDSQG